MCVLERLFRSHRMNLGRLVELNKGEEEEEDED
jgi:hypothetical protein